MKISVVICTYNRDKFILDCLKSLSKQDLNTHDYEILIINNNCTDNTEAISLNFIEKHPELNCRLILESNQGLSFARNRGINEAKSPIITYIDDDGIAPRNHLSTIIRIFEENPAYVGLGGKVIPKYETQEPLWYHPLLKMFVTHIDDGEAKFKCYGKKYPAGCNMTYKKEVLVKSGGFNNALKWRTDDKHIFFVVKKVSNEIYYIPELKVLHQIDKERITDENFNRLSLLLGKEERNRIISTNKYLFPLKWIEYFLKYVASLILAIKFRIQNKPEVAKYIITFRRLALKGLTSS